MPLRLPSVRQAPVLLAMLLLASCVERRERIVVAPDGLIEVQVIHRSEDPVDLFEGDAIPDAEGGWATELREEFDAQGRARHVFEARRTFAPGEELPAGYGPPGARSPGAVLRFPTELRIEPRRDGTWYHFRRVYEPRRWAELGALAESPPAKRLREFSGLDAAVVPAETFDQLARALVDLQAERTLLLARRAFLATATRSSQDGWLGVDAAMRRLAGELDARAIVEQFQLATRIENEAKRTSAIQKALKRLEDSVDERLSLAIREECGFGVTELTSFLAALGRERQEAAITEDLADDDFEVIVVMPGEIIGSNGRIVVSPGETSARWSFRGDRLFDRPAELLVSSRLPAGG